jgi:Ca2+-transporting ATPase
MAARALRVLGLAYKDLDTLPSRLDSRSLERGLTFAGLAGLIDPPRPQARAAVERCYAAGIRPVMITGDHKLTALAVARALDIYREGDLALTGADLDFMPQQALEAEIARCSVFARVTPEHKLRIVRAWQKRGQVVAMTGDGVNDAPALKAADIGCAMGITGTDVAKGAAEMILTDDNFATIISAVEEGRGIYANIKKAIHYLLSCNIGEILTILCATLFRFPELPLLPVQLLWLNLVTDSLPALALGVEPVEPGVMERPPRGAGEALFTRPFALRLLWQGALVGGVTLAAFRLGETALAGPAGGAATANTMAFATLTLSQLCHAFDARSETRSARALGLGSNPAMVKAFLVGLALQLSVLLLPPLQGVFSVCPLTPAAWGAVAALSAAPAAVCEAVKALSRRRGRRPGVPHP